MMVYPMEHLPYAKGCSTYFACRLFQTIFSWVRWHKITVLATQEAEAGGLQVRRLPGLQSEFKDSLSCQLSELLSQNEKEI